MATMQHPKGLMLIELITVIVLVGIIAAFTTFFLYSGVKGYLNTKTTTEGALNAQMALDRITLELRNIVELTATPDTSAPDLSVYYKIESVTATRELKYDSTNKAILISVNNGSDYHKLIENVISCSLSIAYQNLDHDTVPVEEVAHIDVGFYLPDIGKEFKTKIFPRNMVEKK
jgi:type II secretory pathway pseudopilin PulG